MRRQRTADRVLLVCGLGLWLACAALHLKQIAAGQLAWVGVYVTAAVGDGFPTVRGFWPGSAAEASGGLAVGDSLLAVGGMDLRGVGPIGFVARAGAAAARGGDLRVPLVYERDGAVRDTSIHLVPVAYPWRMLPLTCTLVLSGALVLARRPGKRVARSFFLLAIAYGLHWTFFFGGAPGQTFAWVAVFGVASTVMLPLILRAALLFPSEVAPASGRPPWWPWLFAVFGPLSLSWIFGVPLAPEWGFRAVFAVNVAFIVTLLAVLTRNFRRCGPLGRRQLKWVLLGMYGGTVPVLLTDVVAAVEPSLWWLHEAAVIAEIVIPVCVLVAIVRTNYFDVDRLITGAAVYSILSVLLLATALAAVPLLARLTSRAINLNPHTMQLVLSVIMASAVVPAHRALSPRMERILFQERHALRSGVEVLLRELAAAAGPEELMTLVGARLEALVRPSSCLIYATLGDGFEPVFARGAEPPGGPVRLNAEAAAIAALRDCMAPVDLERRGAGAVAAGHSVFDGVGAAVLLPVHRGAELAAIICLGAKQSGDVYTPTDLTLLAAVADKVSSQLLRFDTAVILRQERLMNEALRRYVPQPVAARLTRGQPIEGGERDVSVLFVDIRGYSTYSEARAADTVFSMLNRYTEAVSAVIQRRGGTVVEFLGDGLMAVFGAPDVVADHARVSVQAACEVVSTVRRLALAGADEVPISVGVGIASGRAFVGNIQTSDRLVYTAVGDVVNLASRIQGLTRDLHAAIAIDANTHRTAGDWGRRFQRHQGIGIRGRVEPIDVYSLPLEAA